MHTIIFDLVMVNFQKDIQFQQDIFSGTPGRRNVKIYIYKWFAIRDQLYFQKREEFPYLATEVERIQLFLVLVW